MWVCALCNPLRPIHLEGNLCQHLKGDLGPYIVFEGKAAMNDVNLD